MVGASLGWRQAAFRLRRGNNFKVGSGKLDGSVVICIGHDLDGYL